MGMGMGLLAIFDPNSGPLLIARWRRGIRWW
jgi:hypothetical protein